MTWLYAERVGKVPLRVALMIERHIEDRDGIIFVKASGVWTRGEVDAHYDALRRIIDAYREALRPIRILSDITAAERQSPDIESHIRDQMDQTYRPGDRVALLVASAADQQHVRGLLGAAAMGTFVSPMAAEIWLMSEELAPPGAA